MTRAAQLANVASGGVIQVQQTVKTDTFTSNERTNFIDITGMSVAITPKFSSSKILVMYRIGLSIVTGAYVCHLRLLRGSTNIAQGTAGSNSLAVTTSAYSDNSGAGGYPIYYNSMDFLDSPSTTSSTTYKLQARGWNTSAGTFYVNRAYSYGDTVDHAQQISSITAMEIAQ
jgi:hypothetical protein